MSRNAAARAEREGVRSPRKILVVLALAVAALPSTGRTIVGGRQADPGEYPWMAALYTSPSPSSGWFCGGSLVAPDVVVSAAHCVTELLDNAIASLPIDPRGIKLKVLLGRNTLNGTGGEQIVVRRVTEHPRGDLAVLELERASAQQPIRWATPADASFFPPGTTSTIIGWGATSEGGSTSNRLLEAEVPIVSDGDCAQVYNLDGPYEICAGYEQGGVDTCQGDSGGPLMVRDGTGAFIMVGVTSHGEGCARPRRPGVYAEVPTMASFIETFAS